MQRKNAENKLVFAICGLLLILTLAGFVVYGNIQRKKTNTLLAIQNKEILEQKAELIEQKELVEEKQEEILDSIKYAKRIQMALLPNEKYIERNLEKLKKTQDKG